MVIRMSIMAITTMETAIGTSIKPSLADLGALLHLVDPTLPIGGFNHSNGLETFVQQGVVATKPSLEEYVQTQLFQNWVYNDGAYLSLAFEAMATNDFDRLCELDHSYLRPKLREKVAKAVLNSAYGY